MGLDCSIDAGQELLAEERRRIEAEFQAAVPGTDPFAMAVRCTHMPVAISDPRRADNPIVFVNEAFCRMSGYAAAEIVGRNCRFLQGPDTDPAAIDRVRRAVAEGRPVEVDLRNYRKNGQGFWNRLVVAPVRDRLGEVAYFVASQVDVTLEHARLAGLENRNADLAGALGDRLKALKDSESRLRLATEAGRLGIWDLDLRSRALATSPLGRAMFGRREDEAFGYGDLVAALHPDDAGRLRAAVAGSAATAADCDLDCRVTGRGTPPRWIQVRARVLAGPDGGPERLTGTFLDVTEPKRAELHGRALIALDDRLRDLAEPGGIPQAVVEILGRTLEAARAGYGTLDAARDEVALSGRWAAPGLAPLPGTLSLADCGTSAGALGRGADLTGQETGAWLAMPVVESGGVAALLVLERPDAQVWAPDELALVREAAERTRMAVGRRRAEHELRELAATLESQVAARTRALMEAEAALRQAQKMEAVGQLTGGLAHDFNNLLTGIAGSLEMLQARMAQGRLADIDRYVLAAQGAAKRAASLTHRLLAFSRRQTLDPRPTDVNRLVADLEDLVRRTLGPGVTVETVSAGGLWLTSVDPSQLENALLNLCINARDAMPDGGRVVVETANRWLDDRAARERGVEPGQYVVLSVSDEGTGMTPEVAARAFDPFFTTKPLGQGTGLGLSMIYGFAQQSGGQARIYSEVGRGTTVGLYLPRHYGEAEAREPDPRGPAAAPAAGSETVLVVDDEPTIRMLLADVLGDLGYTTLEAPDGAAALRCIGEAPRIDLLVTDVGLPGGMNGRQVADAARGLRPGLKILFITGYAENALLAHGHLDPGMHVLTKPFQMDALAAKVRIILAGA